VVWLPWVAESKRWQIGRHNEYFKKKKFDFLHSPNFKLLKQIKGNFMNDCEFLIHNFS
jgi:hypothetical protein